MTKSKTIIATLGIVAGLGAAALPLASYAASVSGNVILAVEVEPAIAMTITGNNDNDTENVITEDVSTVSQYDPNTATGAIGSYTIPNAMSNPSSTYISLLPNNSATGTSIVTVYTNNASGYTLNVKDSDSTTALTKVGGTDTIPALATAGTAGTPGWSIGGGDLENAIAVSDTDQLVKTVQTKTTSGDATTMTYTVSTAADQATGVYTDTIIYTAATR